MDTTERTDIVKEIVARINAENDTPILKLGDSDKQWERGNGCLRRLDVDIVTLSINIQADKFKVGGDGVKRGINAWLKENLKCFKQKPGFKTENSQNTRYKCSDDEIEGVIEYYAKY